MTTYIYALLCPKGEVRYIGKTNEPSKRLRKHISGAKTRKENHHNANWIRSLLAVGEAPTMEVLCAVPENETWQETEKYFIDIYRAMGFRLTNILEGGGAEFDVRPEATAARAAKAKITRATPEYRAKISKISSGCWADPALRATRLVAMAEARLKPGHHEKRVAAGKEVGSRPEVKAKRSKSIKASFADGSREITIMRPEIKAKREAGMKARWAKDTEREKVRLALLDPERQELMQAAAHSPEAKAKRAAKMAAIQSDPEYLARQSAKTKANWENPEFRAKMEARQQALYDRTHTPEYLAMMRDRRNEAKRRKRAAKRLASKALSQSAT